MLIVEITVVGVVITFVRVKNHTLRMELHSAFINHTHTCQDYSRVFGNHTMRVEIVLCE
jgi:hypothetical protein